MQITDIPGRKNMGLRKKALIVEDHQGLAELLAHVLAHSGVEAEIIHDGAEAIVRLKDGAGDYGLVCSDVELPGASGWTILEWVHTCRPDLPIVLISGVIDQGFVHEANRRGAVAAFRKPFKVAEIQQLLAELFPYL